MTLSTLSKFLYDLKMRKSEKGQLKMEESKTSIRYINPTRPTDPPPMENHCMEDSDCPENYLCIKPDNSECKFRCPRNYRPKQTRPGFVFFKPSLRTIYLKLVYTLPSNMFSTFQ